MKISVSYGPLCLSARGSFDFSQLWTDPRGLTGSELGFVRIAQELKRRGHDVEVFTVAAQTEWEGMRVRPWEELGVDEYDAAIVVNEPDLLRDVKARIRVCEAWLNDWTFCKPDFDKHVDLFTSPSAPHREQVLTNPLWRDVNVTPQTPRGTFTYEPDPAKWVVNHLGCDPWRYVQPEYCDTCYSKQGGLLPTDATGETWRCGCGQISAKIRSDAYTFRPPRKVPGRALYCSSPDRGLHWLLQEWPAIKRAAPEAHLRITYRIEPWFRTWDNVGYFPPIEPLRQRSLFIEECLRRLSDPKWGIEVVGSVSREQIEREMGEAICVAYPCDPVNDFTEGFSCSSLEACAARACPVISDADALGSIYGGHCAVVPRGNWTEWRENVIRALTDPAWRESWNDKAETFAREHTWTAHVDRLEVEIVKRLGNGPTVADLKREAEFMAEARLVGT